MKMSDERGLFFQHLRKTLINADEDVEDICLQDDGDTLAVFFKGGGVRKINIAMDSPIAVIKDIGKQWE